MTSIELKAISLISSVYNIVLCGIVHCFISVKQLGQNCQSNFRIFCLLNIYFGLPYCTLLIFALRQLAQFGR